MDEREELITFNKRHILSLSLFLGQFPPFVNLYIEINLSESKKKMYSWCLGVKTALYQVLVATAFFATANSIYKV